MPVQVTANVTGGIFQMDADTAIPYTVLGEAHPGSRLFNFVVCHDLFDTCENAQIFFRPIVSKYPGMQVLVWNYPGQAFSEWRRDVTLNNKYLAGCLDSLLRHVGVQGTAEFRTDGTWDDLTKDPFSSSSTSSSSFTTNATTTTTTTPDGDDHLTLERQESWRQLVLKLTMPTWNEVMSGDRKSRKARRKEEKQKENSACVFFLSVYFTVVYLRPCTPP